MMITSVPMKLRRSSSENGLDSIGEIIKPTEEEEKENEKAKAKVEFPKMLTTKKQKKEFADAEATKTKRRHSTSGVSKKLHHSKQAQANYSSMKVYSVSNFSSRERLQKKIAERMEKDSVMIDWEKIMSVVP